MKKILASMGAAFILVAAAHVPAAAADPSFVNTPPQVRQALCGPTTLCRVVVSDPDQNNDTLNVEFYGGSPYQENEAHPEIIRYRDQQFFTGWHTGLAPHAGPRATYFGVRVTDDHGGITDVRYRRLPNGNLSYVYYYSSTSPDSPTFGSSVDAEPSEPVIGSGSCTFPCRP